MRVAQGTEPEVAALPLAQVAAAPAGIGLTPTTSGERSVEELVSDVRKAMNEYEMDPEYQGA